MNSHDCKKRVVSEERALSENFEDLTPFKRPKVKTQFLAKHEPDQSLGKVIRPHELENPFFEVPSPFRSHICHSYYIRLLRYCLWKEEASQIVAQQSVAQQSGSRRKRKKGIGEKSSLRPPRKAREEYPQG